MWQRVINNERLKAVTPLPPTSTNPLSAKGRNAIPPTTWQFRTKHAVMCRRSNTTLPKCVTTRASLGPKNTVKISIFIKYLSRNSVSFFGTVGSLREALVTRKSPRDFCKEVTLFELALLYFPPTVFQDCSWPPYWYNLEAFLAFFWWRHFWPEGDESKNTCEWKRERII